MVDSLLRDISVSLFTELTEGDKQYLAKDIPEILKSSPLTLISNLEDLYNSLIECKNSIRKVEFFDEFSENQGYQKALQKLDGQIRNHIKHELQMKVYIDSIDEKVLKAESQIEDMLDSYQSTVEGLKDKNCRLSAKISKKNAEINGIKCEGNSFDQKELAQVRSKFQRDSEKIADLEKNIQQQKLNRTRAKAELEIKNKEYERHRTEFLTLKKIVSGYEEKNYISREKSDRSLKDSFDSLLKVKTLKTPTKYERSVSPLPNSHQQKSIQASKMAQVTQSTKKLEKTQIAKILKTDLSRYKLKPRVPIFATQKK